MRQPVNGSVGCDDTADGSAVVLRRSGIFSLKEQTPAPFEYPSKRPAERRPFDLLTSSVSGCQRKCLAAAIVELLRFLPKRGGQICRQRKPFLSKDKGIDIAVRENQLHSDWLPLKVRQRLGKGNLPVNAVAEQLAAFIAGYGGSRPIQQTDIEVSQGRGGEIDGKGGPCKGERLGHNPLRPVSLRAQRQSRRSA